MADEDNKDTQAPEQAKNTDQPAAAASSAPSGEQTAPKDALTRTNEDLAADNPEADEAKEAENPKPKGFKALLKRFNVYFLLFLLVVVIAVIIAVVTYLNSKKAPKTATIVNQTLTQDQLKQLANSNATVGDSGQTLTVQGNAVFDGQVLVRSNLNVAGTIQLGGSFDVPNLTVSGTANLASTQANSLQVANGSVFQGTVTVQHDLNVAGTASFSGPITASQITVTKLILSGNAQLQVPNHIAFPGNSPQRSISTAALGAGGSASVNGSDTTGTVNINTGNGPVPGCFVTVTFNVPYTSVPHVLVTPISAGAGQTQYYVERTKTTFSICTASAAPANQVFAYDYFITD